VSSGGRSTGCALANKYRLARVENRSQKQLTEKSKWLAIVFCATIPIACAPTVSNGS